MKKKKFVSSKTKSQSSNWEKIPVPEGMKIQHGITVESLPVPRKEARRIEQGQIHHGELSKWINNYTSSENEDGADIEGLRKLGEQLSLFQDSISAMEEHNAALAHERLTKLVQEFPQDLMAKFNLAHYQLQFHKQDPDLLASAEALAGEVASIYQNSPRHIVLCAKIQGAKGNRNEMIALLHKAYKVNPQNPQVIQELQSVGELIPVVFNADDLLQSRFVTRAKYSEMVREQAKKLLRTKQWDKVAKIAKFHIDDKKPEIASILSEQVLENEPEHQDALEILGYAQMQSKKLDKAVATFDKLLAVDKKHYRGLTGKARVLLDKKDFDAGLELLEKAMDADMEKTEAPELAILARPTAEERMERALEIAKKYPDSWVPKKLIADLEFGMGDVKDALQKHMEVFESSSSDDALTMILHELDNLNRLEEAVSFIHNIKDITKRTAAVRWNSANVYLKAGRVKPAVTILQSLQNDRELPHETRFSATVLLSEVYQTLRGN